MKPAIDALLWLLDAAFEGDEQSLMRNLRGLRDEDWYANPPGGRRSIATVLEHVGWAKWMYEDYGFGSASLRGDRPPMIAADGPARPRTELLSWLNEGHQRLRSSLQALGDDAELERERFHYARQGNRPTREIISMLIGHDFYHAGEINHIRALLQGNDAWPY